MKHFKTAILILLSLLFVCVCTSCSEFAYSNSTIVAKITAIDGQTVTLLVGETDGKEADIPNGNGTGADIPAPPTQDGSAPRQPDGEPTDMPELPDGERFTNGEMPSMPDDNSALEPPDGTRQPDGKRPDGENPFAFTASDTSITLTLNEETVQTLSVGNIVQITFGNNGTVENLTILGNNLPKEFENGETPPPAIGNENGTASDENIAETTNA